MLNEIVLIGRLTKDIEVKQTNSGLSVSQFVLAVERTFKNSNGNRDADFISCVIWRKAAENLAQYTHKGSLIAVRGRLSTRSYEKDGNRVYVTEVVVEDFYLLESKKAVQQSSNNSEPAPKDSNANGTTNKMSQNTPQSNSNASPTDMIPNQGHESTESASDNASTQSAIADLFNDSDSDDDPSNLPF